MKRILLLALILFSASAVILSAETVKAVYYGETGCGHCDAFEELVLPDIEKSTGIDVDLTAYDILDSAFYEKCRIELESMGMEFSAFPVLFVGNNAYMGVDAVESGLTEELKFYAENGSFRPFSEYAGSSAVVSMRFLPVIIAGLIDGINPCAFSTLLFFISFLSVQGRSRREMLFTGLLFVMSVFTAYFLLGFGLLNALRSVVDMSAVRLGLKIVVSGITFVFFILSIHDFYLAGKGRTEKIILQLSPGMKKQAHKVIRSHNKGAFFAGGVIITGFTVSLVELACTGQVYLPTIAYMIQTDSSFLGLKSLVIYNVGFILPLAAVFAVIYAGLSQKTVSVFFSSRIHLTKLLLAMLFLFLSVVIWIV